MKLFQPKRNIIFYLCLLTLPMIFSCKQEKKIPNPYEKAEIDIVVFSNDSTADSALRGYGYNIYIFKSLYVHQPNIPAVNGNRGFTSPADAEKTAGLVAYKIKNNIMPPSLTIQELDSLDVLK
jgi:hypothetical protein